MQYLAVTIGREEPLVRRAIWCPRPSVNSFELLLDRARSRLCDLDRDRRDKIYMLPSRLAEVDLGERER